VIRKMNRESSRRKTGRSSGITTAPVVEVWSAHRIVLAVFLLLVYLGVQAHNSDQRQKGGNCFGATMATVTLYTPGAVQCPALGESIHDAYLCNASGPWKKLKQKQIYLLQSVSYSIFDTEAAISPFKPCFLPFYIILIRSLILRLRLQLNL